MDGTEGTDRAAHLRNLAKEALRDAQTKAQRAIELETEAMQRLQEAQALWEEVRDRTTGPNLFVSFATRKLPAPRDRVSLIRAWLDASAAAESTAATATLASRTARQAAERALAILESGLGEDETQPRE